MKIALKKDMAAERLKARARLDEIFLPRIDAVLGPKAPLYAVKYAAALAGNTPDAAAIIAKHDAAMAAVMEIEERRQDLQARIDGAATVFEIDDILASAQAQSANL